MSVVSFPTNPLDGLDRLDRYEPSQPACEGAEVDWWFVEELFDRGVRLCQTCPVKERCLSEALSRGEQLGVWGGLRPAERAALPVAPVVRLKSWRR